MGRFAAVMLAALLLLTACEIDIRPRVVYTPEAQPAELRGARWPRLPVRYCVVNDDQSFVEFDRFVEATRSAFAEWGLEVTYDGPCEGKQSEGNNRNEVGWARLGDGDVRLNEAGATNVRYRRAPGETPVIIEADIVLDSDPPKDQRTLDCLQTTLLHEIGHFFGLPHLEDPALMAPVINECNPELTPQDRVAIDELYG